MPIRFNCKFCDAKIKVPVGSEGRKMKCPRCGQHQRVPAGGPDEPVAQHEEVAVEQAAAAGSSNSSSNGSSNGSASKGRGRRSKKDKRALVGASVGPEVTDLGREGGAAVAEATAEDGPAEIVAAGPGGDEGGRDNGRDNGRASTLQDSLQGASDVFEELADGAAVNESDEVDFASAAEEPAGTSEGDDAADAAETVVASAEGGESAAEETEPACAAGEQMMRVTDPQAENQDEDDEAPVPEIVIVTKKPPIWAGGQATKRRSDEATEAAEETNYSAAGVDPRDSLEPDEPQAADEPADRPVAGVVIRNNGSAPLPLRMREQADNADEAERTQTGERVEDAAAGEDKTANGEPAEPADSAATWVTSALAKSRGDQAEPETSQPDGVEVGARAVADDSIVSEALAKQDSTAEEASAIPPTRRLARTRPRGKPSPRPRPAGATHQGPTRATTRTDKTPVTPAPAEAPGSLNLLLSSAALRVCAILSVAVVYVIFTSFLARPLTGKQTIVMLLTAAITAVFCWGLADGLEGLRELLRGRKSQRAKEEERVSHR